ncbi:TetR/AcrR family transcriptional regulator [Streptosporangiaceae bacterium NEAU-GS5]|nr:TetR/AcrR family transcriptional regulator [Streptosporangiaceae bacterium NEAU-GS5]
MAEQASSPRRRATRPSRDDRDAREVIVTATRRLLDERRFDELSVADILSAADVARGTFYFYFASKQEVLAELVRRAIAHGHQAAEPWLTDSGDSRDAVRHGISEGARLWRAEAAVLRAIVENWRTDEQLTELWLQLMGSFTTATAERIVADGRPDPAIDDDALAATLTWLGERLYYLAAIGVEPFTDEETLVDALTYIWNSVLSARSSAIESSG